METLDFQSVWEQRFIEVVSDGVYPPPEFAEGSGRAEFSDESTLSVSVKMEDEDPPGSGWWNCKVEMAYAFNPTDGANSVSLIWNQIEAAAGDGSRGDDPLRGRLASGRLKLPGGTDPILYDGSTEVEPGLRTIEFSATLGIASLN